MLLEDADVLLLFKITLLRMMGECGVVLIEHPSIRYIGQSDLTMREHTNKIEALKSLKWLAKHPRNRVWSLGWAVLSTQNYDGRKCLLP